MEPNQDKNPEKRSVRFIEGKGFYIALVLCAAVIGVSAWSLLADTKTMDDERAHSAVLEVVPTPVVPCRRHRSRRGASASRKFRGGSAETARRMCTSGRSVAR